MNTPLPFPPQGIRSAPGRRRKLLAFCLALALGLGLSLGRAWADPEILVPPPGATIYARQPTTHLVVRQQENENISRTRVRKDDLLFSPQGIWQSKKGEYYLHFRLPLTPGKNSFELVPSAQDILIKHRPLRSLLNINFNEKGVFLFHRKELLPASCQECHQEKPLPTGRPIDNQAQPLCFSCHKNIIENNWKHSPAVTLQCRSCHQESPDPTKITIPAGKVEANCFQCHVNKKNWLKMAHIHGPVGTGDCTVCHNPHADQNPSQLWAEGHAAICVACHTDKKDLLAEESSTYYIHGIIKGGGCIACHSPHATEHRFQLYKPINELCVGCHTAFKGVVKGHPVGGHPVEGVKDPRRPERTFACTSCHNPHGSDYKFLLIGDILGGQVCSQCHY
jgi:predicted CXXCH cytochrome family protein